MLTFEHLYWNQFWGDLLIVSISYSCFSACHLVASQPRVILTAYSSQLPIMEAFYIMNKGRWNRNGKNCSQIDSKASFLTLSSMQWTRHRLFSVDDGWRYLSFSLNWMHTIILTFLSFLYNEWGKMKQKWEELLTNWFQKLQHFYHQWTHRLISSLWWLQQYHSFSMNRIQTIISTTIRLHRNEQGKMKQTLEKLLTNWFQSFNYTTV